MEEQLDHAQAREILRFQMSYNQRQMKATWALAFFIIGIFLLEEYFGGSQNSAVLVRMGANVAERVKDGEIYRLLSSVFLHAGFMHVFFNTYVLFALGGFFNRLLGESRYLTIFLFSGICGSLASVFFGKSSISVGASGAIWGLFGASLVLALFKTSLLPEPIRLSLRRVTFINLLINLGVSFLPMIDFWAHIGGGLGGFLISLLIVFRPKTLNFVKIMNVIFLVVACLLSATYAASFTYGMITYKPWQKPFQSELVIDNLAPLPFQVSVPANLTKEALENNTRQKAHFSFGNPQVDRLVMELQFFHESILGKAADRAWLIEQRDQLLKENSLAALVKKTIYFRDNLHGGVLYFQQAIKNSDMVIHNYMTTQADYAVKIGVLISDDVKQKEVDQFVDQIIASIKPTT